MKFYLGTGRYPWLWRLNDVPLFVSHRVLRKLKGPFKQAATTDWVLDSGGFTEISMHGKWVETPEAYVGAARRYMEQLGRIDWVAPQDWMCEPHMIAKTGLSVGEHQRRTIDNYLLLTSLAPDIPFVPVVQGWTCDDYLECVDMYQSSGVDLSLLPVVGLGSVCRRQSSDQIEVIVESLWALGLRLHGFGVKSRGLQRYGVHLLSADSHAWSYAGWRWRERPCPDGLANCGSCLHHALEWRERLLRSIATASPTIRNPPPRRVWAPSKIFD